MVIFMLFKYIESKINMKTSLYGVRFLFQSLVLNSACSSRNVTDQVPHPHKTAGITRRPTLIIIIVHINTNTASNKYGRDSSVGIATRYGLDGPGIESRWGGEIFRTCPDRPWGPPSLLYKGYRVFPGVKAAGAWR
jgi:hypothetical protein